MRTASLMIKIRAKVASTCDMWSRRYRVRNSVDSSTMPKTAVKGTANKTPHKKDWVRFTNQAAKNAPTMYNAPWARLIMSMMPNTRVKPEASKNNIKPNCNPLRLCSRNSIQVMHALIGQKLKMPHHNVAGP